MGMDRNRERSSWHSFTTTRAHAVVLLRLPALPISCHNLAILLTMLYNAMPFHPLRSCLSLFCNTLPSSNQRWIQSGIGRGHSWLQSLAPAAPLWFQPSYFHIWKNQNGTTCIFFCGSNHPSFCETYCCETKYWASHPNASTCRICRGMQNIPWQDING